MTDGHEKGGREIGRVVREILSIVVGVKRPLVDTETLGTHRFRVAIKENKKKNSASE